jgi:hypothetical protein
VSRSFRRTAQIVVLRIRLTSALQSGMTHARYQQLLHAWYDFLDEDRKSINGSRAGPDHDSWPAFQKKLESFQHYQIDSECSFYVLGAYLLIKQ